MNAMDGVTMDRRDHLFWRFS